MEQIENHMVLDECWEHKLYPTEEELEEYWAYMEDQYDPTDNW